MAAGGVGYDPARAPTSSGLKIGSEMSGPKDLPSCR
jgi:hypothetical protein